MLTVVLFFFIIVSGTGGELCVSRAMRSLGEVHDFSPKSILKFVSRGLRLPWMWAGVAMMALGFFSLLAILSFRDVSFVVPVSALSYAAGAFWSKSVSGRENQSKPMDGNRHCMRRCDDRVVERKIGIRRFHFRETYSLPR